MLVGTPVQESITVIHSDDQGFSDYAITLTCTYTQESGQWVGVCEELGTTAFSDTLEHAQVELREAMELQLNEVERLGYAREYLDKNQVTVASIPTNRQTGFTFASVKQTGLGSAGLRMLMNRK
jgi:predicted RNase H-like HicB family nuclease